MVRLSGSNFRAVPVRLVIVASMTTKRMPLGALKVAPSGSRSSAAWRTRSTVKFIVARWRGLPRSVIASKPPVFERHSRGGPENVLPHGGSVAAAGGGRPPVGFAGASAVVLPPPPSPPPPPPPPPP